MAASADPGGDAGDADPPDSDSDEPEVVDLEPPQIAGSRFGPLGDFIHYYLHVRAARKKAKQGYVEWYLVDGTWPDPTYVKPKSRGAGVLEVDHGGDPYFFDRSAMLPNPRTGAWAVVHKADDATPLNLRDPDEHALDPGVLQHWRDMNYQIEPPGFLDNLDIDGQTLWYAGIGLAVLVSVLYQVM